MAGILRLEEAHDDMRGQLGTALAGGTSFTPRLYRNTGIAFPHIANTDVLTFNCQIYHRKKMGTNADSFHIHYIPIGSANGTIIFDYAWGWWNVNTEIPDTLPNTGSAELTLATTDQYKYKIFPFFTNFAPPPSEGYGSYLLVRIARNGGTWSPAGVNANELAILDADAHVIVDRAGSLFEASDV